MIKVNKMDRVILSLSQEHDNDANSIQFDVSEWVQKFGPGTITLTHKRKGDKLPYPVNLEVKGNVATWIISDVDTAKKGYGSAQLMYQPEDTDILAQSAVARTLTMSSNYQIPSTPEPFDNWMAELAKLAGTSKLNADHAKESEEQAAASEQATREMREVVSRDKAEIESKIEVAEHDIDAKTRSIRRYIEEEKAGLDETIETAERSIEASVNTAIQEAKAATAAKNAAEKKATEVNQYVDTAKQQAAESKRQAEAAATEATKAATSEAAAKTAAQEALGYKNTAANIAQGLEPRVDAAKLEIENKGKEVMATLPEDYTGVLKDVSDVKEDLSSLESALDTRALKTDLDIANRKIDALEAVTLGKDWIWQESEDVAYSKDVPKGAVRMGINKIGGKSLVWNQLWNSEQIIDESGTTHSVYNGEITVNGTVKNNGILAICEGAIVPNHKYYLAYTIKGNVPYVVLSIGTTLTNAPTNDWVRHSSVVNATSTRNQIYIYGSEVGQFMVKDVIVIDLTKLGIENISFEEIELLLSKTSYPYNEGTIISSQTDALELRGKNLYSMGEGYFFNVNSANGKTDEKTGTIKGSADTSGSNMTSNKKLYDAGTYTFSVDVVTGNTPLIFIACDGDGVTLNGGGRDSQAVATTFGKKFGRYIGGASAAIVANEPFIVGVSLMGQGTAEYKNAQLVKGSTQTPFVPYSLHTIPTNFPVLRSAGNVYDYIDCTNARPSNRDGYVIVDLVNRIGVYTFTENSNVGKWTDNWYMVRDLSSAYGEGVIALETSSTAMPNIICADFKTVAYHDLSSSADGCMSVYHDAGNNYKGFVGFVTTKASTNAGFLALMKGKQFYYELKTPTVTEIEIPVGMLAILVEGGGQLTFRNADDNYHIPIPNKETFMVKVEEAI